MLGQRVVSQAGDVGGSVLALQITEFGFFFQQTACVPHITVQEHAHAQAQVVQQTGMQFANLGQTSFRELAAFVDFFVFNVLASPAQ